jgi:adenylylsulfate kinase-like enzyme
MIIWLTGQPGSGKTTLAKLLQSTYPNKSVIVDGDDIRDIFDNKDYSEQGRRKNIELAQNIAKFIHKKGDVAIVSLVSPYKDQRDNFKSIMSKDLIEVYVHTSDIRGREQFHVPNYQPPTEFFIDINTTNRSEDETIQELNLKLKLYE